MTYRAPQDHMTRRSVVAFALPFVFFPSRTLAQSPASYVVATLSLEHYPRTIPLATCAGLDAEIAYLEKELARAQAKPEVVGQELLSRASGLSAKLEMQAKAYAQAQKDADLEKMFAAVSMGVSAGLAVLGLTLSATYAVGVVGGLAVLTTPALFALQAIYSAPGNQPDLLFGYARDRALLLGKMVSAGPGKLVVTPLGAAASLFMDARRYSVEKLKKDVAKKLLSSAMEQLKLVETGIAALGTDKKKWGQLYSEQAQGALQALKAYRKATERSACELKGPTLRALP